jgi:glutathione S-transferase
MKLYMVPVAPNPTRVRLYVAEKRAGGADIELSELRINLMKGEQDSADHLARNPFGRVPVLELGDGTFLGESLAIVEYLEECHPEPPMIGREPGERARVRELERIAEMGVLQPVARIVHATNSPLGLEPDPRMAAYFRPVLEKALRVLDEKLSDGRGFVAGDTCSIADCTLQAAFQFARYGKVDVYSTFENLPRWDENYRARPAATAVLTL